MHQVLVDFGHILPKIWEPIQVAALLVLLFGYSGYHFFRVRKVKRERLMELDEPAPEFGVDYLQPSRKRGG